MGSSLFLSDLLTGHEPALAPERELSQLAALRQATRLSRFSARANIRAAVWDKPRSDCTVGVSRFLRSRLFLCDLPTAHEPRDWSAGLRPGSILRPDTNAPGRRPALRSMESSLFLSDLPTGHEPALAPERELSQLAALRQATPLGRFSARANIRAAVWDKPRSDSKVGVSRFMESQVGPISRRFSR